MTEQTRAHSFQKSILATIGAGGVAAGLVLLARQHTILDFFNNFLPFAGLFLFGLAALCLVMRRRLLMGACSGVLIVVVAALCLSFPGAARQTTEDASEGLRVITFNLWIRNVAHSDDIVSFLEERQADVVLFQEVSRRHAPLLKTLDGQYPHRADAHGLAILSKHPIVESGDIRRPRRPGTLILWSRLDVKGKRLEIANVHVWWPFDPSQQERGIASLKAFTRSRTGPLIVGGDFNMTPWTGRLQRFTDETGLRRFNTTHATWPARLRGRQQFPLFPIDNVFVSEHFAKIGTSTGPWLGSDHRPVIADIALID